MADIEISPESWLYLFIMVVPGYVLLMLWSYHKKGNLEDWWKIPSFDKIILSIAISGFFAVLIIYLPEAIAQIQIETPQLIITIQAIGTGIISFIVFVRVRYYLIKVRSQVYKSSVKKRYQKIGYTPVKQEFSRVKRRIRDNVDFTIRDRNGKITLIQSKYSEKPTTEKEIIRFKNAYNRIKKKYPDTIGGTLVTRVGSTREAAKYAQKYPNIRIIKYIRRTVRPRLPRRKRKKVKKG